VNPEIIEQTFREELYKLPPLPLIAFAKEWAEMTSVERDLLSKILASIKLTTGNVRIICSQSISEKEYAAYSPKFILAFGVAIPGISDYYEVNHKHGIPCILAHPLLELEESSKKRLWGALKRLFS
jgi:hypothetical protein